jgi:hypothetical protein
MRVSVVRSAPDMIVVEAPTRTLVSLQRIELMDRETTFWNSQ